MSNTTSTPVPTPTPAPAPKPTPEPEKKSNGSLWDKIVSKLRKDPPPQPPQAR